MKCNVCKSKINVILKIFFNQNIGLECTNCHSILKHKKSNVFLSLLVMVSFLIAFTKAIEFGGLYWLFSIILFVATVLAQYYSPLIIYYTNKA
jgi:hypothetical protein